MEPIVNMKDTYKHNLAYIENSDKNIKLLVDNTLKNTKGDIQKFIEPLKQSIPDLKVLNDTEIYYENIRIANINFSYDGWRINGQLLLTITLDIVDTGIKEKNQLIQDVQQWICSNQLSLKKVLDTTQQAINALKSKQINVKQEAREYGTLIRHILVNRFINDLLDGKTALITGNTCGCKIAGFNLKDLHLIKFVKRTKRQGTLYLQPLNCVDTNLFVNVENYNIGNIGKSLYYYIVKDFNIY